MLTSKNIGINPEHLRESIITEGDSVNICYHGKRGKEERKGKEKKVVVVRA